MTNESDNERGAAERRSMLIESMVIVAIPGTLGPWLVSYGKFLTTAKADRRYGDGLAIRSFGAELPFAVCSLFTG